MEMSFLKAWTGRRTDQQHSRSFYLTFPYSSLVTFSFVIAISCIYVDNCQISVENTDANVKRFEMTLFKELKIAYK